jgi:hypothetical protein
MAFSSSSRPLLLLLKNVEESLKAALQDSAGTGSEPLYGLYSSTLETKGTEFQRMIGVLLTTAPRRLLRVETTTELVGVRANLVKRWVRDLGSLLYQDETANDGIRVRHLSISKFTTSDHYDYQVKHQDADVQIAIACLMTIVNQLHFNVCKSEDSRLANAEIEDLPT